MPATPKIQFQPLALKNQHHHPPEKHHGTEHRGEWTGLQQSFQSGRCFSFGDEIPGSVTAGGIAKFLFNDRGSTAILFRDVSGLGRIVIVEAPLVARSRRAFKYLFLNLQKRIADHDFTLALGFQPFTSLDCHVYGKCPADVQESHKKYGQPHRDSTPIG
jgi:hypothetical protein